MRVLRPVVFPKPLLMSTGQSQTSERAGVGAQLVGDQQFRHEALLLEQLTHEPQGRPTIAAALDQHVENFALVIDGAHRYSRSPAMRTTISSKCQRSLGRGRPWRRRRAIAGPNFSTQRRTVSYEMSSPRSARSSSTSR